MFDNIDKRIKRLAESIIVFGCLFSLVYAIVFIVEDNFELGFAIALGVSFSSCVISHILYALGEIVTQLTKIANSNQKMQILEVCKNSQETTAKKQEIIAELENEMLNDYENNKIAMLENEMQNDYENNKIADIDEEEKINTPQDDECPVCFNKITPHDTECPNCGYNLKEH